MLQDSVQQASTPGQQAIPPIYGYGFVMGGAPHSGPLTPDQVCANPSASLPTTAFGGSGAITVPVWIEGDVCITGGANPAIGNPAGSTIPVHIGGAVYVNGPNYAIGTPTSPVASAAIISGCWAEFHGWKNPACDSNTVNANNGGSGVYATDFHPAEPLAASLQADPHGGPGHQLLADGIARPARQLHRRRHDRNAAGQPVRQQRRLDLGP